MQNLADALKRKSVQKIFQQTYGAPSNEHTLKIQLFNFILKIIIQLALRWFLIKV